MPYEMKGIVSAVKSHLKLEKLSTWKQDVLHLIYPNVCLVCENELAGQQQFFCSFCKDNFQYTYFEQFTEPTPLDQLFWGRVPVYSTYAYLYFEKEKSVQPILHGLKYKDKPQIGIQLGTLIGQHVQNMPGFKDLQVLIPVPLHPRKEFTRGYNQSEKIADGIGAVLQIPVMNTYIKRTKFTESQTRKTRFLRWDNVANKFIVSRTLLSKFTHIALVDDVITTGSTLEAIIQLIHENNPEIRISVLSLALTK